ncbi:NADH-quinone oxidoreductase subunit E [Carbonactinospora thermoautotrophica]|uniref:NAD(P)H-dependent oxidoreductase subunit E n=1 Tax=Carbonactinospora thermoautotrophica TaxID=1469144 RepID=UPI00226F4298|nr:NAD(P)H-dependent oxidoreductase subunit E [Carbonactinospora thermoautotrophica]MCX9192306.1 NADH-quinone oxidoreductase subunit E [Carbonactinospora thermoautotrophica]
MDLHFTSAVPTPEERAAVDAVCGPPATRWEGAERGAGSDGRVSRTERGRRHLLLPVLHSVQKEIGWISEGAVNYVARRLTVPPAEVYGVATFYAMFSTEPRPPRVAHVCDDLACRVAGAEALAEALEARVGPAGAPAAGGKAMWLRSPCLGMCERAPAAMFQMAGRHDDFSLAPARLDELVAALAGQEIDTTLTEAAPHVSAPQTRAPRDPSLRLLRRVGVVNPYSIDDYRAHGGYEALRRAVQLGPTGVIREVTDSKLLGRGGAAFPTGVKWAAVARAPERPHYVICNADESEPGTFKDRVLMEQDPYALIEAMTIAGFATGSEQGYLYIRGEYPLATRRLSAAIAEARARGLLGDDVMGMGFRFDIELRRGAGAYICGEETALLNSIEGFRGEPRNKPPFPTQAGLFGKPTVINNVETLVNVLDIVLRSGPDYASTGTTGSTGTKLFCVSGSVARPGVYEVEFGMTLRDLLALAGGIADGRSPQAVLLGGAAGSFVTPDKFDVPLTFEDARAIGASLGSGVVMVFDDRVDLIDILTRIAAFFRDESCGQCVPCRVGTVRQEEALQRIARGREIGSRDAEIALLGDLARVMRDASICGLGQTAAAALQSAISCQLLNGKRRSPDAS